MPRFVLLRHQFPSGHEKPSHWDFMLQQGKGLKTWSLASLPQSWCKALGSNPPADLPSDTQIVSATQLPDHRLAYLEYEGSIRGNRGVVRRCDSGTYQLLSQHDSLEESPLEIALAGAKLQGTVLLQRDAARPQSWQLRTT